MAEYTIELRTIVEGGQNIFPFDYPFYDEKKRPDFERNFIRHFYFREIGVETVDRFVLHLEDKMKTVFPYYNELFKTAAIEYSVLDNYDIRETTTMKRENTGSSAGESYSVGKIQNDQTTETSEDRNTHKVADLTSEKTRNQTDGYESSETYDGTVTPNLTEKTDANGNTVKKYLDTPQGAVDLKTHNYLTSLNDDTVDSETTLHKTGTEDTDYTKSGSSERTVEDSESVTNNDTVDQEESAKTSNTFTGEERTTSDNNTRTHSEGTTTETIEHTRKGNIGVDTDADMIQKHIQLQKILTRIEKMFFDECDDLFMLVW